MPPRRSASAWSPAWSPRGVDADRDGPGRSYRRQSALAVQSIKSGLRTAVDPDWNELGVWVSTNLARLFKTNDHREG